MNCSLRWMQERKYLLAVPLALGVVMVTIFGDSLYSSTRVCNQMALHTVSPAICRDYFEPDYTYVDHFPAASSCLLRLRAFGTGEKSRRQVNRRKDAWPWMIPGSQDVGRSFTNLRGFVNMSTVNNCHKQIVNIYQLSINSP